MKKTILTFALLASVLVAAPVSAATATLTPSADTYIKDGASSNQNFGTADDVFARNPEIRTHKGLIKFSGVPANVTRATLRLYVVNHSPEAGKVRGVASSWTETGATWKNRPDLGPLINFISGDAQVGTWKEVDVTSAISGSTVDFYLIGTHQNAVGYASRETSKPPQLVVTMSGATATSTTTTTTTTTAPAASSERLVASGDIASCGYTRDTDTADLVMTELAQDPAATVLTVGDNVYPDGTKGQYSNCYHPTWGRFKSSTKPTPGNHDWNTSNAQGYRDYFGYGNNTDLHYTFSRGDWRLIALDTEAYRVATRTQRNNIEDWMVNTINNTSKQCVLIYGHHPRYSAGHHGDTNWMDDLWDKAHATGKVFVWLSGHDHNYERRRPENHNGSQSSDGIRQFIIGFGGTGLRNATADSGTQVVDDDHWGVLVLDLGSDGYDWRAEATDGSTIDSGSMSLSC